MRFSRVRDQFRLTVPCALRKVRSDVRAAPAADPAHEPVLDVGQSKVVRPEVGADPDAMAAVMVAAIDQHVADACFTHLAKGDFLRMARWSWSRGSSGPVQRF